jgi:hypothetical protein
MSGQSYRGRWAAFRAVREAIYAEASGAGLQNEPMALELMQWADEMERSDALSHPGWVGVGTPFSFMLARRQ